MQNESNETQPDLFDDHVDYVYASQGSRFLNFLIDNLLMRFALSYLTAYIAVEILKMTAPDFLYSLYDQGETSFKVILFSMLVGYLNYLLYYTFCEAAFKGITLGKLVTGTKAIRLDGGQLTFKDALLRSLSRIVPFEVFSALGQPCNPWHDKWTNTTVIRTR